MVGMVTVMVVVMLVAVLGWRWLGWLVGGGVGERCDTLLFCFGFGVPRDGCCNRGWLAERTLLVRIVLVAVMVGGVGVAVGGGGGG